MLFRREFYGYFKYSQVREWIIIQTHLKNYLMLVIKSIPNQISFWESTVFLCCWQVQNKCKKQEFVYIKMLFSHMNNDKIMIQSIDTI